MSLQGNSSRRSRRQYRQRLSSGKRRAAVQMHLEIGTLRTQVQGAQAVPQPREATTSLVDTRLLGKPESFDGGAGRRIGALFSEAMRVLVVRRWACSWNERRDQLDQHSTRR